VFGMTGHMVHHVNPEAVAAALVDLPAIETGERVALRRRPATSSAV
jgi:hypothetical protein